MPIIPHFSNECLSDLGIDDKLVWPGYDLSFLENEQIKIVIQINGKKRSILNTKKNIEERDLLKIIKEDKVLEKYLNQKTIVKTVYVQNRLMNILVNE